MAESSATCSTVDEILSRPDEGTRRAVAALPGPVVVLGAGGKIGLHLCLMLREAARDRGRDLAVVAVSRFKTLRDRESFSAAGVGTLAADLSNPEEVSNLPDAPTVFFLAGVKFGTSTSPDLLETMNVRIPRLVAERYSRSTMVAFSTGCVYPFVDRRSGGADESTPPSPVGAYAESCVRRERAFIETSQRAGTPTVLVRLNYAVEFRYGVLVDIAVKVLKREPIDVTTGYVNVIWQRDAVSHIIQCVHLAATPPAAINIAGAETVGVRWLAQEFGRTLRCEPILCGVESTTAWLSDARRAHQLLGPPAHGIRRMIHDISTWLLGGGETWGKPTGFEKRDGQF